MSDPAAARLSHCRSLLTPFSSMSLLSRTETAVTELPSRIVQLRSTLATLTPTSPHTAFTALQASATALATQSTELDRTITKLVEKARETDPDKKMYGTAAVKRIEEMAASWADVKEQAAALAAEVDRQYQAAEQRRVDDDKRRLREAEEARQRAEEERVRAEAERLRKAEEDERRRQEEAERRAAEEAERLARLQQQKLEAEQKAKAATLARQHEQERKQKEETERKAKEAADKQAAEAADAQRRADEEAKKPPLQRSREALEAALGLLCDSCSVDSDRLIAVQMLLKFVTAIVTNPMDETKRRVNVRNPIIKQRLLGKKGGLEALRAIGFNGTAAAGSDVVGGVGVGEAEEWKIGATAEGWNVVVQAKGVLEKELEDVKAGKKRPPSSASSTSSSQPLPTPSVRPSPTATATPATSSLPSPLPPTTAAADSAAADDTMSEEQLLQQALAMSMTINNSTSSTSTAVEQSTPMQTDAEDLTEEQLLEQALSMSMQTEPPPNDKNKPK